MAKKINKRQNRNALTKTLVLCLLLISIACNQQSDSPSVDVLTIKGNIKEFDGKSLYLKQIDPLNYHSNSLIDSVIIQSNGDFEFKITKTQPRLLNISKYGNEHPIHDLLRNDPDKYYYGYCAMFYIPEPTIYLADNSDIQLDWTASDRMDSYSYDKATATNQDIFYNYYLNEDVSSGLYQEDGDYKIMNPKIAWAEIEGAMAALQLKYGLTGDDTHETFKDYLSTEINLGGLNMYLTWYEHFYSKELDEAFATGEIPELYTNALKRYARSQWNEQSVEYYKMTERFVTFNLNKANKAFNEYYPWDENKSSMVQEVLNPSVANKYENNNNPQSVL